MDKPDVEQLLQQMKKQKAVNERFATPLLGYVRWAYFVEVSGVASAVLCVCFLAAISILACVVLSPRLRGRVQRGLEKAKAGALTSCLNAKVFTLLIAVWVLLIALSTIFSLMRMTVVKKSFKGVSQTLANKPSEWIFVPAVLLFFLKFVGALGVWLYVLFLGGFLEVGVVVSWLVCFPAFYESLCLSHGEPNSAVVWVTHSVFLLSLLVAFSMSAPWIKRELRISLDQIQGYLPHTGYHHRPEFKELKKFKKLTAKQHLE